MKQSSRVPRMVSLCCALILHIGILLWLFFMVIYHLPPVAQYDDQRDDGITVTPISGAPGAQIMLYEPPKMPLIQELPSAGMTQELIDTASKLRETYQKQEKELVPAMEDAVEQEIGFEQYRAAATSIHELQSAPTRDDRESPDGDTKKQPVKLSRKAKKEQAMQELKGLSFVSCKSSQPLSGSNGVCGDPTDTQEIMYRMYASKIIRMLGTAINAEKVRLLLDRDIIRRTTLCVTIRRDGTLVDVRMDPCTPELTKIADAIRSVAQSSGLYPRIPHGLRSDPITIRIPLQVDGKSGMGEYHFSYARY